MRRIAMLWPMWTVAAVLYLAASAASAAETDMDGAALDVNIQDKLGGGSAYATQGGEILLEDNIYLKYQSLDISGGKIHAWSDTKDPIVVEMRRQKLRFNCADWTYDQAAKRHTLAGSALIVQKNDKDEESLFISGENVTVTTLDNGAMRLVIRQASDPKSPKARLRMKTAQAATVGTAALWFVAFMAAGMRQSRRSPMRKHRKKRLRGRMLMAAVASLAAATMVLGAAPSSPFGASEGEDEGSLDLAAFVIEVTIKEGEFTDLNARGNVTMDVKGMTLRSDLMKYDPAREMLVAEVNKAEKVRITGEDSETTCGRVEYDMKREIYNLSRGFQITQPGLDWNGTQVSVVNDGGKMNIVGDSATSAALQSGVDASGQLTQGARDLENSVEDIQRTLGISRDEALRHVVEPSPTEIRFSLDEESQPAKREAPSSGLISEDTWEAVPGSVENSGLEPED